MALGVISAFFPSLNNFLPSPTLAPYAWHLIIVGAILYFGEHVVAILIPQSKNRGQTSAANRREKTPMIPVDIGNENTLIVFTYREPSQVMRGVGILLVGMATLTLFFPWVQTYMSYGHVPTLPERLVLMGLMLVGAVYMLFYSNQLVIDPDNDRITKTISIYKPIFKKTERISALEIVLLYDTVIGGSSGTGSRTRTVTVVSLGKKMAYAVGGKPNDYKEFFVTSVVRRYTGKRTVNDMYRLAYGLSECLSLPVKDFRHPDDRPVGYDNAS